MFWVKFEKKKWSSAAKWSFGVLLTPPFVRRRLGGFRSDQTFHFRFQTTIHIFFVNILLWNKKIKLTRVLRRRIRRRAENKREAEYDDSSARSLQFRKRLSWRMRGTVWKYHKSLVIYNIIFEINISSFFLVCTKYCTELFSGSPRDIHVLWIGGGRGAPQVCHLSFWCSSGGAMTSSKMHYFHTILIKMTHSGPKRDKFVPDKIRVDIFRVNAFDKPQNYNFTSPFTDVSILVLFLTKTLLWRHCTTTSYRRDTKSLNGTPQGLLYHLQFTDHGYLYNNPRKPLYSNLCTLKKNCYYSCYWSYNPG